MNVTINLSGVILDMDITNYARPKRRLVAGEFYELHDGGENPLTICATCAPQAKREGWSIGMKRIGAVKCVGCGTQRMPPYAVRKMLREQTVKVGQ